MHLCHFYVEIVHSIFVIEWKNLEIKNEKGKVIQETATEMHKERNQEERRNSVEVHNIFSPVP